MVASSIKATVKAIDRVVLAWYVSQYPWSMVLLCLGEAGVVLLILVCCVALHSFV